MTTSLRITLIALALALIAWGVFGESHRVQPLGPGESRSVGGSDFISDAAVDGYLRIDGTLFDAYTPLTPGQVQLKDCKT
jgi:hypothetical protein